jgi:hypothetical protein
LSCPKCGFEQPGDIECPRCGILFAKYFEHQRKVAERAASTVPPVDGEAGEEKEEGEEKKGWFILYVEPHVNPFYFGGRALVFLFILFAGFSLVFSYPIKTDPVSALKANEDFFESGTSRFLHKVSTPFHEAGHYFIFRPFGGFIMVLGGTLAQLMIPTICLLTLLFQTRDNFGSSIVLWWLGFNFQDCAFYINDARSLVIPLISGQIGMENPDTHDWHNMLSRLGMLEYDHALAGTFYLTGSLLMFCAFAWGGYLLYRQYRNLEKIW